jgi:hypothetical protein
MPVIFDALQAKQWLDPRLSTLWKGAGLIDIDATDLLMRVPVFFI